MLMVLLLTIGLNFYLIDIIPKGFFPQQDTGAMVGNACRARRTHRFR
jgi:multidrug efflux pump